jgi:ribose transport system substrate-binding protein
MRRHLRGAPSKRTLIGGINDSSALGALRAFQEVGRQEHCAMMGQTLYPRAELREAGTRLIGSVVFFPNAMVRIWSVLHSIF